MTPDKIYIVVPCYNEQEVLGETAARLSARLAALKASGLAAKGSRILLVDDGSKDKTWSIIERLHSEDSAFAGLKLSRNQGHQNALLAGLMAAKDRAGAVISMDADLQDDIGAVDKMLLEYRPGTKRRLPRHFEITDETR